MKSIILLFAIFSLISAKDIRVAVAANVSYAMQDIIKAYKMKDNSTKITTTIGSSGKLAAQILNGAPYDIFLSANQKYPQNLYEKNITKEPPKVYVKGQLVLFSTKDLNISKSLELLESKKVKKIAVANPKTAPYGVATKEALINAKIYKKIEPKFVYGESIGQTLIFTLKAADIGIVAKSQLYSKPMSKYKEGKDFIDINSSLYTPTKQAALLLSNKDKAREFYNFLFSKEAKDIFRKYGYIVND